jgi:aspartate oxidase
MQRVQLHPTGFIDPAHPDSTSKFLAPEALRGSGGVILNQLGERFANELGSRSYLTDCIHRYCDHYVTNLSTGKTQTAAYMFLNAQVESCLLCSGSVLIGFSD